MIRAEDAFHQEVISVVYNITPVTAPRMTRADAWKKRPVVLRYRAFRDEVRARDVILPIPAHVIFYMPMPASWSKRTQKAMHLRPHESLPDLDNLLKALLDSLFEADGHVWSVWPEKFWSMEPGIQIASLQSLGRPQ
jgi:Holliday junction resolvase RusA-like endonuclease